MTIVPNSFPSIPDPHGRRLAIVGEAPGSDEVDQGQPFVGQSGQLLRRTLSWAGIDPNSCLIANVCQQRPESNDIKNFEWQGPEIQAGIVQLKADLQTFRPNCILSLGRTPFRLLKPDKCYPVRVTKENPDGIRIPISDWRGSPFISDVVGCKVIPSYHPAYILRAYSDIAYFKSDLKRAVRHSGDPKLHLIVRTGNLRPTLQDVVSFLNGLIQSRTPASFDIEGYADAVGVTMLSICPTPDSGIVIPFQIDGKRYWSEDEEPIVWFWLSRWLADKACPKRAHNFFYEYLVLTWRHGCLINGVADDTMMMHWEVYNELEKSLGVCTSLWIEEPYYKDERESSGDRKLLYNFKDSACTEEIARVARPALQSLGTPFDHYQFNVSLIYPYAYMHLRGCKFDTARATQHHVRAETELQGLLERINLDIEVDLGHPFNPKSTDDKQWFLYEHLKVKPFERYGLSTKEELLHRFYKKTKNETLKLIIQAVSLRTRISDIEKLTPNEDGRIRTSYDVVSTVTARLNSRESSITEITGVKKDGSFKREEFGTNLQNVTKALRDCFIPDSEDMLFWQADLEGADAWTVAADLAACGDDRMLNDLKAHVKPSKMLLAMLQEIEAGRDPSVISRLPSDELKGICDAIVIPEGILPDGRGADWKYVTMKRVQHGTNYLAQSEVISATIFKDSDGLIDVAPIEVDRYQRLYKLRYNVELRKNYILNTLIRDGCITTAMGTKRKFFGIRNSRLPDDDIVRQAMASEPQTNTTGCTNLALKKLWYDPENRRRTGALFIEPLLQIHDALAGQVPARLRDFAKVKLKEYFNNPIKINGIIINIPADIKVGKSWGECKEKI